MDIDTRLNKLTKEGSLDKYGKLIVRIEPAFHEMAEPIMDYMGCRTQNEEKLELLQNILEKKVPYTFKEAYSTDENLINKAY